jgi:hypothetical protein
MRKTRIPQQVEGFVVVSPNAPSPFFAPSRLRVKLHMGQGVPLASLSVHAKARRREGALGLAFGCQLFFVGAPDEAIYSHKSHEGKKKKGRANYRQDIATRHAPLFPFSLCGFYENKKG